MAKLHFSAVKLNVTVVNYGQVDPEMLNSLSTPSDLYRHVVLYINNVYLFTHYMSPHIL